MMPEICFGIIWRRASVGWELIIVEAGSWLAHGLIMLYCLLRICLKFLHNKNLKMTNEIHQC